MRKHLPILCIWSIAYVALVIVGARVGLQPACVFVALLILSAPPLFFCLQASRKVMNRTRVVFPEHWAALNADWLKFELRLFLFDERTFGDEVIAAWKQELRCWLRAGMVALVLFLPTLLLIQELSK